MCPALRPALEPRSARDPAIIGLGAVLCFGMAALTLVIVRMNLYEFIKAWTAAAQDGLQLSPE